MKKTSLILFILIKIAYAQNTDGEQFLYDCLVDKFNSQNINLVEQLSIIDSSLVFYNIIEKNDSLAYYKLLQNIIKSDSLPTIPSLSNKIVDFLPNYYFANSNKCLQKLKSFSQMHYINSRVFYLSTKLDSLVKISNLTPRSIARLLISTLTPEDFNTPYFRTILLLGLYTSALISNNENEFLEDSLNEINIIIKQNGEIVINDSLIKISLFNPKIKKLIKQYKSSYEVKIFFQKTVSKSLYISILDEIKSAINSLRNEKSIEIFSKQYSELDKDEMATINGIFPIRIKINSD